MHEKIRDEFCADDYGIFEVLSLPKWDSFEPNKVLLNVIILTESEILQATFYTSVIS